MGFYSPSQIVADAQRHGVTVYPADVGASDWDSTLDAGALLKPLFDQVKRLAGGFKRVEFNHVPREQNREADKLACLGLRTNRDGYPNAKGVGEESPSSKG